MTSNNSAFSEWYHYLFLAVWLVVLMVGLKYYPKVEKTFTLKTGFANGSKIATGFFLFSFILGFVIFFIQTFDAEAEQATTITYIIYGVIALLLLLNAFLCFKYYVKMSAILRMLLLSVLIVVYFFSGLLGGLLIVSIFALVVIIYAFVKFKNILTIK